MTWGLCPGGGYVRSPCETVRNLGAWFDSELHLIMKTHKNKVVSICYYHLRRLRQLQHCFSQSTLTVLVTSLILQRLDYNCNSALAGLPASSIDTTTTGTKHCSSSGSQSGSSSTHHSCTATATLATSIHYRIQYKIAMHHIYNNTAPTYLRQATSLT